MLYEQNNEEARRLIAQHTEQYLRQITPSGNYDISVSEIENGKANVTIETTDPVLAEVLLAIKEENG
mgnify:CR=1 FL=1